MNHLKHGHIWCSKRPKFNALFSFTSLFLKRLDNSFLENKLLNGHVYFLLLVFDYCFMAQDAAFVILNEFHGLVLFGSVHVNSFMTEAVII